MDEHIFIYGVIIYGHFKSRKKKSGYWKNSISKIQSLKSISHSYNYKTTTYSVENSTSLGLHLVMGHHTIFILFLSQNRKISWIWGEENTRYHTSVCATTEKKEIRFFDPIYCKTVMLLIDLIFDPCFFSFIVATYYYLPISSEKRASYRVDINY